MGNVPIKSWKENFVSLGSNLKLQFASFCTVTPLPLYTTETTPVKEG